MHDSQPPTWAQHERLLFWTACSIAGYFLLIWGSFQLKWEPVWLGVIRELFTLPLMAGQLILPMLAFFSWKDLSWKTPSFAAGAMVISLLTVGLTIGSLLLAI